MLVRPDHVETIPIDATGPVTAFAVSEGANLFAVAARSENPTVLVVDGATHAIRTSIQGAASLEVDSIAISRCVASRAPGHNLGLIMMCTCVRVPVIAGMAHGS